MNGGRIAVFLDRDGTLIEEVNFLRTPDQLHLIAGAGAAVRALNSRGIITCIISNQSAVARGLITEEDLVPIHAKMERELQREGARVDRIYYCPHHPSEGKPPYNISCDCRKPAPGMLMRGERELGIDLARSFVVGDRIVDVQAGKAVGALTILVQTGYGRESLEECNREKIIPDVVTPSIAEAAHHIMKMLERKAPENG